MNNIRVAAAILLIVILGCTTHQVNNRDDEEMRLLRAQSLLDKNRFVDAGIEFMSIAKAFRFSDAALSAAAAFLRARPRCLRAGRGGQ